jgi:hypothetical protein
MKFSPRIVDGSLDGALNGAPSNTAGSSVVLNAPWSPTTSAIPTLSAADAYTSLIVSAGAFPRDSVDNFALGNVTSLGLKGQLYKDQALTGLANDGYGTIAGGTPFANVSGDGIADYWATANGISTVDPTAGNAEYGATGYNNIEVYLNSLVLPTPWSSEDITGTPLQGASSYNPFTEQWLLTGSGLSIPTTLDQGQFVSQSWSADGSFTAKLLTLSGAGAATNGGIMLRDSNSQGATFVAVVGNGGGGVSFLWRSADGQTAQGVRLSNVAAPVWLRIVRKAGTYAGYFSTDNTRWTLLGIADVTLPSTVQYGLVFASGSATALGTASFSNVGISTDTGSLVSLETSTANLTYPASANVTVTVNGVAGKTPTGSVQIFDGSEHLSTLSLQGDGKAYWYVQPLLSAGTHLLTATYVGDATAPAGFSSGVTVVVAPSPTTLSASCWNAFFPYGANYSCTANVSSNAGAPTGTLHYTVDGSPFDVSLSNSNAQFSVQKPEVGSHTVTLNYPSQGNFAASQVVNEGYTVTAAPTQIILTPSSYYQSIASPLLLRAVISTWSTAPPSSGTVTFYDGSGLVGTVPVAANGTATLSVGGLTAGVHTFTAVFNGNLDYAAGTSQASSVQLY